VTTAGTVATLQGTVNVENIMRAQTDQMNPPLSSKDWNYQNQFNAAGISGHGPIVVETATAANGSIAIMYNSTGGVVAIEFFANSGDSVPAFALAPSTGFVVNVSAGPGGTGPLDTFMDRGGPGVWNFSGGNLSGVAPGVVGTDVPNMSQMPGVLALVTPGSGTVTPATTGVYQVVCIGGGGSGGGGGSASSNTVAQGGGGGGGQGEIKMTIMALVASTSYSYTTGAGGASVAGGAAGGNAGTNGNNGGNSQFIGPFTIAAAGGSGGTASSSNTTTAGAGGLYAGTGTSITAAAAGSGGVGGVGGGFLANGFGGGGAVGLNGGGGGGGGGAGTTGTSGLGGSGGTGGSVAVAGGGAGGNAGGSATSTGTAGTAGANDTGAGGGGGGGGAYASTHGAGGAGGAGGGGNVIIIGPLTGVSI
jgi:hypothetical protein